MRNKISEIPEVTQWLNQFKNEDLSTAIRLLDELMLVDESTFAYTIFKMIEQTLESHETPIAVYAEREVIRPDGYLPAWYNYEPFFEGASEGRAEGDGPPPIYAQGKNKEIGSEGPIANIISKFQKKYSNIVYSHAGPNQLRDKQVSTIVIVTDFIGSGDRLVHMLNSFKRVASIRSWFSYKKIEFTIIAFSGTSEGVKLVEAHQLSPRVIVHISCPTIQECFLEPELSTINKLCSNYPANYKWPLGYKAGGALIAFQHGIPNNAPALFHKKYEGWKPIFDDRIAFGLNFSKLHDLEDQFDRKVQELLEIRDARSKLVNPDTANWINSMIVLRAIQSGGRDISRVSMLTRLELTKVASSIEILKKAKWVSKNMFLTPLGRKELDVLQKTMTFPPEVDWGNSTPYYPTQLRVR